MTRRRNPIVSRSIALGAAAPADEAAAQLDARVSGSDLRAAACEAYLYTLPLIEMATTRRRNLASDPRQNWIQHNRNLSNPADRWLTAPNNDTLYSNGWLDLTQGPLTLTIPPIKGRYFSVAILNMYTDNDAVLSPRNIGSEGGQFTIVGPNQAGSGANIVRISTPYAWLFLRVLVEYPADLAAAHIVQDGFRLDGPEGATIPKYAERGASPLDYYSSARGLMSLNPPPAADTGLLRRTAAILGPHAIPPNDPAIAAGVEEAKARLLGGLGRQSLLIRGWSYQPHNVGVFGQDYFFRASTALGGLGALPRDEAMYLGAADENGHRIFNGDETYRVTVPGDLPINGFWSLTIYEIMDGQVFLTENVLHRYSIGDRTPGIRRNPDGSIDVWISRTDPGGDRSANWLPAPQTGPYVMPMRCFLPKREFLSGAWRMPPIAVA